MSIASIALVMKLISIGVMRMDCPMLINRGVCSSPKNPNGPEREKSRYNIRPSTTVGIPIKALNEPRINRLPLKVFNPNTVAIGILQSVARTTANPDTYNDSPVIL